MPCEAPVMMATRCELLIVRSFSRMDARFRVSYSSSAQCRQEDSRQCDGVAVDEESYEPSDGCLRCLVGDEENWLGREGQFSVEQRARRRTERDLDDGFLRSREHKGVVYHSGAAADVLCGITGKRPPGRQCERHPRPCVDADGAVTQVRHGVIESLRVLLAGLWIDSDNCAEVAGQHVVGELNGVVQELLYCLARNSHDAEDTGEHFVGQDAGAAMWGDVGDKRAGVVAAEELSSRHTATGAGDSVL